MIKESNIMRFFGDWPGDKKELDKIKKLIRKNRDKFKLREFKF